MDLVLLGHLRERGLDLIGVHRRSVARRNENLRVTDQAMLRALPERDDRGRVPLKRDIRAEDHLCALGDVVPNLRVLPLLVRDRRRSSARRAIALQALPVPQVQGRAREVLRERHGRDRRQRVRRSDRLHIRRQLIRRNHPLVHHVAGALIPHVRTLALLAALGAPADLVALKLERCLRLTRRRAGQDLRVALPQLALPQTVQAHVRLAVKLIDERERERNHAVPRLLVRREDLDATAAVPQRPDQQVPTEAAEPLGHPRRPLDEPLRLVEHDPRLLRGRSANRDPGRRGVVRAIESQLRKERRLAVPLRDDHPRLTEPREDVLRDLQLERLRRPLRAIVEHHQRAVPLEVLDGERLH